MLFNSIHFLLFFPLVVVVYFVLPHKVRWVWLLVASYYFYMSWNPRYALLILTSTILTYLSGILIDRANRWTPVGGTLSGEALEKKRGARKKLWVALSFISNLSILFFFKYFDFAVGNINFFLSHIGVEVLNPSFDVLLPVGISFYTFQALSYTVDVYRKDIYAEKNFFKYALFVSFFPQLVAGPIERSKNLLVQINDRHYLDYDRMKNGLLLMLWGYFQKLVVADRVAILVNTVFNNYTAYGGVEILVASFLFAFQIYCDFAGYTNIAIGAAQVMGFRLMDNFKQPYYATSIKDFWRRWHISLSSWFRDYLYIPLGGSRCSTPRRYFNIMVTFLASGLWHGASWSFVAWGGLHGAYQIIGDVLEKPRQRLYARLKTDQTSFSFRLGQILVTYVLVNFAWIFFRANSLSDALGIIKSMFVNWNPWAFFDGTLYNLGIDRQNLLLIAVTIIILLVADYLQKKMHVREFISKQNLVFRWSFYLVGIFSVLIFGIYGPGYDASQFIYFQF